MSNYTELLPENVDTTISPFRAAFKRTWHSFCATTGIHGLKYVTDEKTNKFVRFIWLIIFVLMFGSAITMVSTFYLDYRSNPTRINVENDNAPVTNLIFPAVTLCPVEMFNISKSEKYIKTLMMPFNATAQSVIDALHVNGGFLNDDEYYEDTEIMLLEDVLNLNNLSIFTFMYNMRWNCDEFLFRCRFHMEIVNCNELFKISRTYLGYCCSFNILQRGVNFTNKYAKPGLLNGLSVIFDDNVMDSLVYSQGYKFILHENFGFPSAHTISKFIPYNVESFISLQPLETYASEAVKQLSIDERYCVLPLEQPLSHFDRYIGANCQLNCQVQKMIKHCGCLVFIFNNNITTDRVCTYKDIPCLLNNFAEITGRMRETQCFCPYSCETVDYEIQMSSSNMELNVKTVDPFYDGIKENFSIVHIFINTPNYRRISNDLMSNMVTLVSNLGSAFSLFVGMSMVSVVEIIFFFSVILRKNYNEELHVREKFLFIKNSKTLAEEKKAKESEYSYKNYKY